MNTCRVKNSGGKLAPHSVLRAGDTLRNSRRKRTTSDETTKVKSIKKIGTWNVRTMLKIGKLENIKIEMRRLSLDILGLCEMRWPTSGDFWSDDVRMIHSAANNGQAGVGIALTKEWGEKVINYIAYSDRLLLIKIKGQPTDLVIIQVYMPTSRAEDEQIEEIYEHIEELIKLTKAQDNTIIMGDWNSVVGKGEDGCEIGDHGLGNRNERGDRLVEFCRQHDMIAANTMFKNHPRRLYTWKMPGDIGRFQIDFILVKKRFKNQVKNCKAYPGADADSDHNLVMMKCNLKYKTLKSRSKDTALYQIRRLQNPTNAIAFREMGEEMIQSREHRKEETVNKRWLHLKEVIQHTAISTLKQEKINKKEPRKQWITEEIVKDIEERRQYKNRTDSDGQRCYNHLRNKINRDAKKAKEIWIEDRCKEVEEQMKNNQLDMAYGIVKHFFGEKRSKGNHIRDKNGTLILDDEDIAARWRDYLEELYGETNPIMEMNTKTSPDEQGEIILYSEFETAMKEIKKGKTPGVDEIPIELIIKSGEGIKKELFQILNLIYTTGELPEDFTRSIIIPIPKKAKADQCSQFRTISLLPHASKILTKIVYKRMDRKIEEHLGQDQYGFRRGRGTREAILGLRQIQEKQVERQKSTFLAFVDIEKAFDSISWGKLFPIMDLVGLDFRDKQIIFNLYRLQEAEIKINETKATAKIKKGSDRDAHSPHHFLIFI